ncbi:MAG: hypothetical protein GAK28_00694 [Luteibacter sp.]|uniref:phage tail terminator protein n=1 Tax=Luteibacter sp. TaxID=1886636 RepID=UPI00137C98AE|nr:hypothetical protein [Luteibacter sp.]KAF1009061.1 MAG: hypothetical protein GAK28_00694 [Luteibacter sp.]
MSTAPFDVNVVVERLRESELQDVGPDSRLREIGMAADYAAVKNLRDFVTPSAFVLLAREQFDPQPPSFGLPGQQVTSVQSGTVTIGVVIAARNYREQGGAQLSGEFELLLGSVRARLLGWVPPIAGARPLQLRQGELLQYDNATALWCDVWSTTIHLSA